MEVFLLYVQYWYDNTPRLYGVYSSYGRVLEAKEIALNGDGAVGASASIESVIVDEGLEDE